MSRLFAPEIDPTPYLAAYPRADGKWYETSYGVAFSPGFGGLWSYRYDEGLPGVPADDANEETHGVMSGADVKKALDALQADPRMLRTRPASIITLEALTGRTAHLKTNYFGGWHLYSGREYSLFNNPFGVELGYTDSADTFEVWFRAHEAEPREYVSLDTLCGELRRYGYTRAAEAAAGAEGRVCAACGAASVSRCARCRGRRYCSRSCQAADWPEHRAQCDSGL